jgi:hypothetical protein
MPRYPVSKHIPFYNEYNAMLFVNEPPIEQQFSNLNLDEGASQESKVNVISYTNYEWNTIDYCAACSITKGQELLVFYGTEYRRSDYNVNFEGCNVGDNKSFFE